MTCQCHPRLRAVLFAVVAVTGLALTADRGLCQTHMGPRLTFGVLGTSTDTDDTAAFEAAKAYFSSLEMDKDKKKVEADLAAAGAPPSFPNKQAGPPPSAPKVTTAQAFGAVSLPQLTLGEGLLAASLLAPPRAADPAPVTGGLKHSYRWVKLSGREARLVGLDPNFEKDEKRNKVWVLAAEGRKANLPFLHPTWKWILYSRTSGDTQLPQEQRDKTFEFFALVRVDPALTEKDIKAVKAVLDDTQPSLLIWFDPPQKLKDFTDRYKPTGEATKLVYRYMVPIIDNKALTIVRIEKPGEDSKPDGKLQVSGQYRQVDIVRLEKELQAALKPPVTPTP